MTLTLEIPAELDAQIERAAQARGTDAAAWMLEAARRTLDPDLAFDALIEGLTDQRAAQDLLPLSDDQVSRAAFYAADENTL